MRKVSQREMREKKKILAQKILSMAEAVLVLNDVFGNINKAATHCLEKI